MVLNKPNYVLLDHGCGSFINFPKIQGRHSSDKEQALLHSGTGLLMVNHFSWQIFNWQQCFVADHLMFV